MFINFQDNVDEYLLRGKEMSESERVLLELQLRNDKQLMRQLELRRDVMAAIASREEKLRMMGTFKERYDYENVGYQPHQYGSCFMIMKDATAFVEKKENQIVDLEEEEEQAAAPVVGNEWATPFAEGKGQTTAPVERGRQAPAPSHRKRW